MLNTTEQLWDAFHEPLQQFIRRCVSNEATAEDVLQDVFLKIHQHVETLRDVKKLESWDLPDRSQHHYRLLPAVAGRRPRLRQRRCLTCPKSFLMMMS